MDALIVQEDVKLGDLWKRHLEDLEINVSLARTGEEARNHILDTFFDVILLDLVLSEGSALAVADLARFRQPEANVVFVTDTTFFSDGSIFHHSANARAFIKTATPPQDLAEIVHYYGATHPDHGARHSPAPG